MSFHPDFANARLLPSRLFSTRTLPLVRAGFSLMSRLVRVPRQRVELDNGQYLLILSPRGQPPAGPVLLWLHGGGLVMGAPELELRLCRRISRLTGLTIVLPSYRLAPRHRYPAALDDALTAYEWLTDQHWQQAEQILVGGSSAGGGLAAALILALQPRGQVPKAAFLHQPMLDAATCDAPDPKPAEVRLWDGSCNRIAWNAYLADQPPPYPATAVPANASDAQLAAFPPTWLSVGTADLFHPEATTFARRLQAAGVATRFYPLPGAFHGFETFAPGAATTRRFFADFSAALTQATKTTG